jgi:hypothetical protein
VAKKKGRYKKRNKRRCTHCLATDKHHILFMKRNWNKGLLEVLRTYHYCVIPIPKCTLHRYIHECLHDVPAPSIYAVKGALEQLELLDKAGALHDCDPIEKRLKLLIALFECSAQPTADALKKQLNIVRRFYEQPP